MKSMESTENECEISQKFNYFFLKAMEELKLKRMTSHENDSKIKELLTSINEKDQIIENEKEKFNSSKENYEKLLHDMEKNFLHKLNGLDEINNRQQTNLKLVMEEISTLKNESRNLQMTKFSLENQINELETKLKFEKNCHEEENQNMKNFKSIMTSVTRNFEEVQKSQDRVKEFAEKVQVRIKAVENANQHKSRMIDAQASKMNVLEKEIIKSKFRLNEINSRNDENAHFEDAKLKLLSSDLELREKRIEQLTTELALEKQHRKDLEASLIDANTIVNLHKDNMKHAETMRDFYQDAYEKVARDLESLQVANGIQERRINELQNNLAESKIIDEKPLESYEKHCEPNILTEVEQVLEEIVNKLENSI